MTDHSEQIRPTRHRLHAAMGVSALCVAAILALLDLLVDLSAGISIQGPEHGHPLSVVIKTGREPDSELALEKDAAPASSQQATVVSAEAVDRQRQVATRSSPVPPADSEPVKDWRAVAKSAARASVDDDFRSEESRASMWRRTRSTMFAPASEFVAKEQEPVISGVRFRPQVHVLGLGLTIGSCFIGVPILGVPIEQRTVAINLFVCASDSG